MNRFRRIFIILTAIILALTSCTKEQEVQSEKNLVSVMIEQDPATKADLVTSGIKTIRNLTVAAYDSNGDIADKKYFTTETARYLSLRKDLSHTVLVYVNMGDLTEDLPETLTEAKAMKRRFSWEELNTVGFPMTGQGTLTAGSASIKVSIKRLLAKVTLTIDTDWPENTSFTLKKVIVGNTNANLGMFAYSKAKNSSDLIDGDYTYTLTSPMTFYVPENRQGTLLPDNTDPYLKNRQSLINAGKTSLANLCSYMDIILSQEDTYGVHGDRRYRFYIGRNNTSNFDVIRNYDYDITLKLTAEGMDIVDNWKVDNGQVTDTRSLSFGKDVYNLTPGRTGYVDVNYSQSGIDDLTYSHFNTVSGWSFSNLSTSLSFGDIIIGQGFAVTPLADKVAVGDEIPLSIQTFDRKHSDEAIIRIVPSELNSFWQGDFKPSYIAQKGTLETVIPEGVDYLSYVVTNGYEGLIELSPEGNNSTTVSSLGAGEAKIDIIGHNGDNSYKLGEYSFDIVAPTISPSKTAITLSADGTRASFIVSYRNRAGTKMSVSSTKGANYFDSELYERLLTPDISFSNGDAGMFLGNNSVSVYVNKMSINGNSVLDFCGSEHSGQLCAQPCDSRAALDIGQTNVACTISDPFPNSSESRSLGLINNRYDGSMGSVSSDAYSLDKIGDSSILQDVISSISDNYITFEATIPDMQMSLSGGKLKLSRIESNSYSAGSYRIKAAVRNKYSGELSSYKTIGVIESYVMTGLKAQAEEIMNDYYISVVFANSFSIDQFSTIQNYLKTKKIFGFAQSSTRRISTSYYVFDHAEDDNGNYIDPESNDFYTWGSWCDVFAFDSNTLVGCNSYIYSLHVGLRDLTDWEYTGSNFYEAYVPQATVDVSRIGSITGVSYQTIGEYRLFYLQSDTIKGKTGLPYHLIGLPVSNTVQLPIPWKE